MDKLRTDIMDQITCIEQKWTAQLKKYDQSLNDLEKRIEIIEEHNKEPATATYSQNMLTDVIKRCDVLERKDLAADAILFGVPQLHNENIKSIFNHLCHTIDSQPPVLRSIFRSHQRDGCNDPPIILKFSSPQDKNIILKSVAEYQKKVAKPVSLRDIGIDSDKSIYLNESLTKKNRSLLKYAVKLKRQKKIFSVFTRNGTVFVKERKNENNIMIDDEEALNAIALGCQAADEANGDGVPNTND